MIFAIRIHEYQLPCLCVNSHYTTGKTGRAHWPHVLKRLKVNGLCKTYSLVSTQPWAATGVMTGENDIMSVQENVQRITLPQPGKPNMQSKKIECVFLVLPQKGILKKQTVIPQTLGKIQQIFSREEEVKLTNTLLYPCATLEQIHRIRRWRYYIIFLYFLYCQ